MDNTDPSISLVAQKEYQAHCDAVIEVRDYLVGAARDGDLEECNVIMGFRHSVDMRMPLACAIRAARDIDRADIVDHLSEWYRYIDN